MGKLDSLLAGFMNLQCELESDLPTEGTPVAVEPLPLLPVRLGAVAHFLRECGEQVKRWVINLVEVLTYHALMGKAKMGPPVLTPAQEFMVTRFAEAVEYFINQGGDVELLTQCRKALGAVKCDYSGEPVQYMEELVAEKVVACWPAPHEAAVQNALDFVGADVKSWLENPRECLLPVATWPDKPPHSRVAHQMRNGNA